MIRTLARDLPALWQAESTTAADRQTIVRHLIDRVVAARGRANGSMWRCIGRVDS